MKDVELLCVRTGFVLYWPSVIGGGYRGSVGTVVRKDDPLINFGSQSQMHVFCGAPEGAEVSPHNSAAADQLFDSMGFKDKPPFNDPNDPFKAKPKPAAPAARPSSPPKPVAKPDSN